MIIDRLQAFLGKPYKINKESYIYSPSIEDIASIGYIEYVVKLNLCLFDKEKILLDLFNISPIEYFRLQNESDYEVLTDNQIISNYIAESLSFFTKTDVVFDIQSKSFCINNNVFVDQHNYLQVATAIKELNGLSDPQNEKTLKPKGAKAKLMLEKMMAFSQKTKKSDDSIELKDMLSIICSANGNGIDIFNVSKLTVYQVYEQFERLTLKDSFERMLPVWANGHLSENSKLPEWIAKTKF